jgi:hypothetical protein
MPFADSGELGVNLAATYTAPSSSTPEVPGLPFALGQKVKATNGQEYMFVLSSGTHALGALVAIDESFTSRSATTAIAKTAGGPGWPQAAIATDTYYWCAVAGRGILGKQKDGTAADAQLFTSTSVGIMGSDASTGAPVMIAGVRNVALSSGAGAAYAICAVNPHFIVVETME